jgi:hypothetical protein
MVPHVEQAVALLHQALEQPLRREELVNEFLALVWHGLSPSIPKAIGDVLGELAMDLDYFEASAAIRQKDPECYGDERLEQEIRDSLRRLGELGVDVAPRVTP